MERIPLASVSTRIRWVLLIFAMLLAVMAGRLVWIQVLDADKYKKMALGERLRQMEMPSIRGIIFDRNGEELAVSVEKATVFATPYLVKGRKKRAVAARLAPLLGEDEADILKKLRADGGFVYLKRKIPRGVGKRISRMKIPGVGVVKASKRFYPLRSLGAHTIGFAGLDNKGLAGIELAYNETLQGKPGYLMKEIDPAGRPIPGGFFQLVEPERGKSVVLTIDRDIQYHVEGVLAEAVEETDARAATAIVMNPRNGEVYALANNPTFDLNKFHKAQKNVVRNRAVVDIFEPGSTMKIITAAAYLEEKRADVSASFYLPSQIRVADRVIKDAHKRGAKSFTFSEIIAKSSNVGAVSLGIKLGKEKLHRYIKAFGLTEPTEIDFPGEVAGSIPDPDDWSGSSIGNIPFGQGLAVTPIQLAKAISIIANDGLEVQPHLVSGILDKEGRVHPVRRGKRPRKVITARSAERMRRILAQVVTEGTGKRAKLRNYAVGGKTGTAQKVVDGRYASTYIASFVGFTPVEEPELLTFVMVDEPEKGMYGGVVAAPIYKKINEFAVRRLRIQPQGLAANEADRSLAR